MAAGEINNAIFTFKKFRFHKISTTSPNRQKYEEDAIYLYIYINDTYTYSIYTYTYTPDAIYTYEIEFALHICSHTVAFRIYSYFKAKTRLNHFNSFNRVLKSDVNI